MKRYNDQELILLMKEDRNRGFRMFFESYYMCLCLYALQITDDFNESEDIVQNFFVRFWEENMIDNISTNFHSYVYTCIRNSSIKWMEQHNNTPISVLDDDFMPLPVEEMDVDEMIVKERELRSAVDALPAQERNALFEVVLGNKKYKEAAQSLGISVNTLKTHLSRALKNLRQNDKLKTLILILSSFYIR